MTYATRQSALEPVLDQVTAMWTANLTIVGDVLDKARWYYEQAPAGAGSLVLLLHAGALVGCAGVGTRLFWDRGEERERPVALLADLTVVKAHRTLLPALVLLRALRTAAAEGGRSLQFGFPNNRAIGAFERVGYRTLGKMRRYVRVLRHGRYLRREGVTRLAAVALGAGADTVRLALATPRAAAALWGHALRWLDQPDERFDRLWEAARPRYPFVGRRDAAFVSWRCLRRPGPRWRLLALESRADRSLKAYAAVEEEGGVAHIHDLFGLAPAGLLDAMIPFLWARGAAAISFRFLGDPEVERMLVDRGFEQREASRAVVCHGDGPALPAWYLTDVDEDN